MKSDVDSKFVRVEENMWVSSGQGKGKLIIVITFWRGKECIY